MAYKVLKGVAIVVGIIGATLFAVRAFDAYRAAPLSRWHTFKPHELNAKEIDSSDWARYLAAENTAFEEVRREVTSKLDQRERVLANRYFDGSPIYPPRLSTDWNRSYVMMPDGAASGAVVLGTGSPIHLTACGTSRAAIATRDLSRWPSGSQGTERFPRG